MATRSVGSNRADGKKYFKTGTTTTKNHRFEPFTQRVARLKIDPIHKLRQPTFEEGQSDHTAASFFKTSLDHWIELNLSENFTEFARKAGRLCESLPQILYHEDTIMGLLVEYIDKRDALSMEPLLSLLAQFARDLGRRFEKHFPAAVTLVSSVAAKHQDIDVIEWSFSCLAWIFKFLSSLLAPDLRQLLSIMAPYLGKERQKAFVARFAAESLSFLIRKAARGFEKDRQPLEKAVSFLLEDLRSFDGKTNFDLYQEGIMTLLSEAAKGIKDTVHTCGVPILGCLISQQATDDDFEFDPAANVLYGVLTHLLHHTSSETAMPLLDVVYENITALQMKGQGVSPMIVARMLFIIAATRGGARVHDWKLFNNHLITLLRLQTESKTSLQSISKQLLIATATTLAQAPMNQLMPSMNELLKLSSTGCFDEFFPSFCFLLARLDRERFQSIALPHFQKFIAKTWQQHEQSLCALIPKMYKTGAVSPYQSQSGYLQCPDVWKNTIVDRFASADGEIEKLVSLNAYTQLFENISFKTEPSAFPAISKSLHKGIKSALEGLPEPKNQFLLGPGLVAYGEIASETSKVDASLWPGLCTVGPQYATITAFLQGVNLFLKAVKELPLVSDDVVDAFVSSLILNLSAPSHELRLASLKILERFQSSRDKQKVKIIALTIEIEEAPLTLESARSISSNIRRLGALYPDAADDKWLSRIVPSFCFGLLNKRLAQLWDDSCEVLKVIVENRTGEECVSDLALRWVQQPPTYETDSTDDDDEDDERNDRATEFQCFKAMKKERFAEKAFQQSERASELLSQDLDQRLKSSPHIPNNARPQALKVFNAVPSIAEKHSRQVVPIFLGWAAHDDDLATASSGTSDTVVGDEPSGKWNLRDRKDLLKLFGQFHNPKVLFKTVEVHTALLALLSNAESEVQKLSLKALFTWKDPGVQPYEERLLNLLDDARFRDELSTFVQIEKEDSTVEDGHREAFLPILLRILYGRMVSRSGSSNTAGAHEARRRVIMRALAHLSTDEFKHFVRIAFGQMFDLPLIEDGQVQEKFLSADILDAKKHFGLLKTIETMFDILQSQMEPFAERSLNVVVYSLVRSCRLLYKSGQDAGIEQTAATGIPLAKNIRQTGLRCLDLLSSVSPDLSWQVYLPVIFKEVIDPRLDQFAIETAQTISGLLRLFHTWASSWKTALFLSDFNPCLIERIADCLVVKSAKEEVKFFVLDKIMQSLLELARGKVPGKDEIVPADKVEEIKSRVILAHAEHFLQQLAALLKESPSKHLLASAVNKLSMLAPFVEACPGDIEVLHLVDLTVFLLQQPANRVNPKMKGDMLRILQSFLALCDVSEKPELWQTMFDALTAMFDYFKDQANREVLSEVFVVFSAKNKELLQISELCRDLNSYSTTRLDEFDFDRRLAAFTKVNEELYETMTPAQWQPILHNFLFHVKDGEELAIRSSASHGLRRFIERSKIGEMEVERDPGFAKLVENVLIPALQRGVKESDELVRTEFVTILGHFVSENPAYPAVSDMVVLLVNNDEEASFFSNILHIQQHRRARALRRLADEARQGKLQSKNIATIFLPLIEHFVFDKADDESAHNLAAETLITIGALAEGMEWGQFRAIMRRYKGYMDSKQEMEKTIIKLLSHMTDGLCRALGRYDLLATTTTAEDNATEDVPLVRGALSKSLPSSEKLAKELSENFITGLTAFIHNKDETEVSLRVPVAVITVKLLRLLPDEQSALLLPPVLLDIATILKSRSQDSRDTARKTLTDIAIILGPSYFGYILKELRATLTRGYQLHVLSFTVHSIMVATADRFKPGDLDYCLRELVTVIMDDIFGTVGQEKESEDYVSKMKEVKSSKSFDSMELLAKNTTVPHIPELTRPIQILLEEKLNVSLVKKIDELLRRIGVGILRNPDAENQELLVLSYQIIQAVYKRTELQARGKPVDAKQQRFLVNLFGPKSKANRGSTSSYIYKLVRFALDVIRSVLNKYNSLMTPGNVAGFLPVIGDALIQAQEEVKISAMRLLATIIKLPLPDLDRSAQVYINEAARIVKDAPNTNTEAAQAALKLTAAVLRERKSVKVRDADLAYFLKKLKDDIEEPDKQGVTFNFIKAVMARKLIVPEIYDLVDSIAAMMVTNHSKSARDLARGVYCYFLVEYPQAQKRWSKQLAFLIKNLDYKYPEGRKSVMEAVHTVLGKTGDELTQELVGSFFVPLVLLMANDDSQECRDMAAALLGEVYTRANSEKIKTFLMPLHQWLEQEENIVLTSTGLQAFRIYFDSSVAKQERELPFALQAISSIIKPRLANREDEDDWEPIYYALQLFSKVCSRFPEKTIAKNCAGVWEDVRSALTYPHLWIKACAANLVGLWFADLAKTNATIGYDKLPLVSANGLALSGDGMIELTKGSLRVLSVPGVGEELATQAVRNLVFLGRCLGVNDLQMPSAKSAVSEADDEEIGYNEEDGADEEAEAAGTNKVKTVLNYLFAQISRVLRREPLTTKAISLVPKTAAMRLVGALCNHISTEVLTDSLATILLPLQIITDPSIHTARSIDDEYNTTYKSFVASAHEVQDLLQKKFGTTKYVDVVAKVQEGVRARREERRSKRRIEAVADPEKTARIKVRKGERKKEKRKEKSADFRGRRRGW